MDHYRHTREYIFKRASESQPSSTNTSYINSTSNTDMDIELDEDATDTTEPVEFTPDVREEWKGKDLWENETVTWDYEGVYSTTLFTAKAQETIEKHDPKKVTEDCITVLTH